MPALAHDDRMIDECYDNGSPSGGSQLFSQRHPHRCPLLSRHGDMAEPGRSAALVLTPKLEPVKAAVRAGDQFSSVQFCFTSVDGQEQPLDVALS